jgi:hypothetical protein
MDPSRGERRACALVEAVHGASQNGTASNSATSIQLAATSARSSSPRSDVLARESGTPAVHAPSEVLASSGEHSASTETGAPTLSTMSVDTLPHSSQMDPLTERVSAGGFQLELPCALLTRSALDQVLSVQAWNLLNKSEQQNLMVGGKLCVCMCVCACTCAVLCCAVFCPCCVSICVCMCVLYRVVPPHR